MLPQLRASAAAGATRRAPKAITATGTYRDELAQARWLPEPPPLPAQRVVSELDKLLRLPECSP